MVIPNSEQPMIRQRGGFSYFLLGRDLSTGEKRAGCKFAQLEALRVVFSFENVIRDKLLLRPSVANHLREVLTKRKSTRLQLRIDAAGFIAVEGNRVPSPASQASGDLLYRGATEWERLAKGTDGHVLTLAAGAPSWAAPAVSGGMTLLGTLTTTSGTSHSLNNIPAGYRQLYIEIENVSYTGSVGRRLQLALSVNNGSTYTTPGDVSENGTTNAASKVDGTITVYGISASPLEAKFIAPRTYANLSAQALTTDIYHPTLAAGVVDAIRFTWGSSQAFDAGTIRIYGVK